MKGPMYCGYDYCDRCSCQIGFGRGGGCSIAPRKGAPRHDLCHACYSKIKRTRVELADSYGTAVEDVEWVLPPPLMVTEEVISRPGVPLILTPEVAKWLQRRSRRWAKRLLKKWKRARARAAARALA